MVPGRTTLDPWRVAIAASAGAAAIHLAAASGHARAGRLHVAFFLAAAVLQAGWAGIASRWRGARLAAAASALNGSIVAVWLVSRTAGLPPALGGGGVEPFGAADLAAALLEVVAIATAFAGAREVVWAGGPAPTAAVFATVALITAVVLPTAAAPDRDDHGHRSVHRNVHPDALASGMHAHGVRDRLHSDPRPHARHAATALPSGVHAHDAEAALHAVRAMGAAHGTAAHGVAGVHAHGASAGCHPTPEQRAAADRLVAETKAAMVRWPTVVQVTEDGYRALPAPVGRTLHYINWAYQQDPRVLDPRHPEALVLAMTDDGYRPIGAMYMMPRPGMAGPAIGGCLTHWHAHGGEMGGGRATMEMLHVWTVDMPGGPFAETIDTAYVASLWNPAGRSVPVWCFPDGARQRAGHSNFDGCV